MPRTHLVYKTKSGLMCLAHLDFPGNGKSLWVLSKKKLLGPYGARKLRLFKLDGMLVVPATPEAGTGSLGPGNSPPTQKR